VPKNCSKIWRNIKISSNLKYWFAATRPKTLPASVIPVAVGSAAAYYWGYFEWLWSIVALVCALLIQIITNYLNEVYDYYRGADTEERKGPERAVAAGKINPKKMLTVSIVLIVLTFLLGLILVQRAGLPVLIIGILSLLFAYVYTGGPYPLAYNGLGDVFVLVFFGIVAVCGTFYVQTLHLNSAVFVASLAPGFLSMNILGINNIRDIETDRLVGKKTLAVKFGREKTVFLYLIINSAAFLVPVLLTLMTDSLFMLLPLAVLPYSFKIYGKLKKNSGEKLNELLAANGKILVIHGLLTVTGFVLSVLLNGK
jgi:1,4-dihydroxy-2-naphthoate octaprenyltransferase